MDISTFISLFYLLKVGDSRLARAKYKEWLELENLTKIEAWARDGLTDEQISHNMGINPKTLYQWKKKYDQVGKALKRGKEVVDIQVENALYKKAIGGYVVEEQEIEEMTPNGFILVKRIRNKRWIPGDTTAQIFWLKNRKSDVWMDRKAKEFDLNASEGVKIIDDIG